MSTLSAIAFIGVVIFSIMANDSKKQGQPLTDQRLLNILALGTSIVALVLTVFTIAGMETGSTNDGQFKELLRLILPWVKVGFIALFSIGAITNLIQIGKESR